MTGKLLTEIINIHLSLMRYSAVNVLEDMTLMGLNWTQNILIMAVKHTKQTSR